MENIVGGGKPVKMNKPNKSVINPDQQEKPNPNAGGGTDRPSTDFAGTQPWVKPGDHA